MKEMIEALLFAKTRGLTVPELKKLIKTKENKVLEALKDLKGEYERRNTGLLIVNEGEKWKMRMKQEFSDCTTEVVPMEMRKSVLETLAVIAWKGPVKQSLVVKMRGNKAYGHIKMLLEDGFVVQEPFGKTYKLKITPVFEDYFKVKKKEIKQELNIVVQTTEANTPETPKLAQENVEKSVYETN